MHKYITSINVSDYCRPFTIRPICVSTSLDVAGLFYATIKKFWESTVGLKQAKGFISGPSSRRTKDLLRLNRDQLRWVVGLLTGHCHLKGHLYKLRLTDDPTCERCLQQHESATHILCDCEAIVYLRFRHLGQFFMEPGDFYDVAIIKVPHFIRSVRLIKG
jgi:hypothetical protein